MHICSLDLYLLLLFAIFLPTNQVFRAECPQKLTTVPVQNVLEFGQKFSGDSGAPATFPCWFDLKLARAGQSFARRNFGHMFFAHALSLIFLLSDQQVRNVLVLTGKSDTPQKCWKRYLATAQQIHLWYHSDILSPQWSQSVNNVRNIHSFASYRVSTLNSTNLKHAASSDGKPPEFRPSDKMWEAFHLDLATVTGGESRPDFSFNQSLPRFKINQYTMAMTTWAFMALPVLNPNQLGLSKYSERDLQGYAHLWAIIGFALGTNEEFIFCKTPTKEWPECKEYLQDLFRAYFLHQFLDLDFQVEVMIEALLRGIGQLLPRYPPDALLINLLEKHLGIQAKHLRRQRSLQSMVLGSSFNWFANEATKNSQLLQSFFTSLAFGEMQLASIQVFGDPGTNSTLVASSHFYS